MPMFAKPVVKNKFWVVENQGQKVATIQAAPDGVTLVTNQGREKFASIKLLSKRHNIEFVKGTVAKTAALPTDVHGFPCTGKPHNALYDVKHHVPVFTKTSKSKSYFCAGHYLVNINGEWQHHYCPKAIVINRHEFVGPFKTQAEAKQYFENNHG